MKRVLKFVVNKQRIRKDKDCDFSNIVAGSSGYLYAEFEFTTDEWDRCRKAASFFYNGIEHGALLDENNTCLIPKEALIGDKFEVSVLGVDPENNYEIPTSRITVSQEVY